MATKKLQLRGVSVRHIDIRPKEGGAAGTVARVHLSADLTEELRGHMEWPSFEAEGDSALESAKLAGTVRLASVQFNPNPKLHLGASAMRQHAIDIAALELSDFSFHRVKDDGTRTEIRFRLMVDNQDGIVKMVGYILAVGDVDAAVKCSLAAEQAPLFPSDTAKALFRRVFPQDAVPEDLRVREFPEVAR